MEIGNQVYVEPFLVTKTVEGFTIWPEDRELPYELRPWRKGLWQCTCPDFVYRRRKMGQQCKHGRLLQERKEIL